MMTYKKIDSTKDLNYWFDRARVGQTVLYNTGYLPLDREETDPHTKQLTSDAKAIDALAKAVLDLAEVGKLHLSQRRIEPMLYHYMATKTTPKSVSHIAKIAHSK